MGIPLAIASRLAEIPATAIEKVANQLVVRYDKQILPLIDLHTIFGDRTFDNLAIETETLSIIIVSPYPAVSVALVVDHILDIVEEALTIKGIPSREGILFSTVIQGKITEILDMEAIIRKTNPYLLQLVNSR